MARRILRLAVLLLLLIPTPTQAKAIALPERLGGFTKLHIDVAKRWLRTKTRIVIRGDQWSAAALQVTYFAKRGGRICAAKNVRLHFHAPCDARTGRCQGDPNKWTTRKPRAVGIPNCS